MNDTRPTSTWALVTGASSGLGADFARLFAADGHGVVLVARRADRLEALAAELTSAHGARVEVVPADLADTHGVRTVADALAERGIVPDFVVNNAGVGSSGRVAAADPDGQRDMVVLNAAALTELTCRMLPGMVARGSGRLLHVGSTAGFLPGPGMATYYATKAYVDSFARALAFELRGTGVTSTLLCPGPTSTEFGATAGVEESRLFSLGTMDGRTVAEAGYRAMMGGTKVAVPGVRNKLSVASLAVTPRSIATRVAAMLNP
ncbi:MAG: SDR family oxidoreductase [Acidimicrobiales bacterium]